MALAMTATNQYAVTGDVSTAFTGTFYWTFMMSHKWSNQASTDIIAKLLKSGGTVLTTIQLSSTGVVTLNGAATNAYTARDGVWTRYAIRFKFISGTTYHIWLLAKAEDESAWTYVRGTDESTGVSFGSHPQVTTISVGDQGNIAPMIGRVAYARYWNCGTDTADSDHAGAALTASELDLEFASTTPVKTTSGALTVLAGDWPFPSSNTYLSTVNHTPMDMTNSGTSYVADDPSYIGSGSSASSILAYYPRRTFVNDVVIQY